MKWSEKNFKNIFKHVSNASRSFARACSACDRTLAESPHCTCTCFPLQVRGLRAVGVGGDRALLRPHRHGNCRHVQLQEHTSRSGVSTE